MRVTDFRSTRTGFADLLPYAAVVDPGIILNKDGSLMAAWAYGAPDTQSSTNIERNDIISRINGVLSRLGSGYMIHVDAVRKDSRGYPDARRSHFPDRVSRLIDAERRKSFESVQAHYETELVMVLTFMPPELANSKLVRAMYSDSGGKGSLADQTLADFKTAILEIEDLLDNVLSIVRLEAHSYVDEHGNTYRQDTFLRHLQHCISGVDHPINLPDVPMYLDAILGSVYTPAISPKIGDNFVGCVAIEGFPQESAPGILARLDSLPMEYRWSTRFIFLDPTEAKQKLEGYRRKWKGRTRKLLDQMFQLNNKPLDGDALEMVEDTDTALAEASQRLAAYGYYTANVIIYNSNLDLLDKALANIRREINNLGFVARIETINANEAYLGSLPGNGYPNVRRPLMHTINLAHMLPLNTVWVGRETNPCPFYPDNSPPLMQVASSGATPFRVNLHVHDVGHTLIFGPTGSGKSTLLALIAAQFRRYKNAQIFAFDKGRSILPLTRGVGGLFYDVGDSSNNLNFAPLTQIDTDLDQAWAEEWITTLLALQGMFVKPQHRTEIHERMTQLRNGVAVKSISNFVSSLQDQELRTALHYYTQDGSMGDLLDSETDTLEEGAFMAFEMEDLMERGEQALMPVLLYLFHRIERKLTGKPSLIILDEAWIMLGHDAFRAKIREWLKVLRRKNCAVILATQSLSDAANSGIMDVLSESCRTKIILPNTEAKEPHNREFYEGVGLNERQIEIISQATPKREYYMTSSEGRRLFDMELGPLALAFVGVSGAEDLDRITELHQTHGESWVNQWLHERGVSYDETI